MFLVSKMNFEYGKKIKELREKENISQAELANALNITRSAINQIEQQYDIIPIKRLNEIANYFGVSIDYLFDLTDIKKYSNSQKEIDMEVSSKRLKEFRKENKLTQDKLAQKLNISRSIIAFHENKRTVIGTPFLYELCKKYHVSADYLLGKTNEPQELS